MLHVACRMSHVACCMKLSYGRYHGRGGALNVQRGPWHETTHLFVQSAQELVHVACCTLHIACCMLHVACCMLHVACCIGHSAERRLQRGGHAGCELIPDNYEEGCSV